MEAEPPRRSRGCARCGAAYIRFALEHPREYWLTFMSGNTPQENQEARPQH